MVRVDEDLSGRVDWPTTARSFLRDEHGQHDGRVLGVDNSLWLYRVVPMAPVAEARTQEAGVATAAPLMLAMDELAALTPARIARRASAKYGYRNVHVLLVNLPQLFEPPTDHPNAGWLREQYPATPMDRRVLLFGVQLQGKVTGGAGSWRQQLSRAVDSIAETLTVGGTPLSDYDADRATISAALGRVGLRVPTTAELHLANSWFNMGNHPDVPYVGYVDRLQVFSTVEAARAAHRAGPDAELSSVGGHTITFAAVADLDLPFVSPEDPRAWWASQLVAQDALAISVRGKIEPSAVTREEMRRNRARYTEDINSRAQAGRMDRQEMLEREQMLAEVEAVYATGGPPTLTETSIVVGFNGYVPDMADVSRDLTAKLLPMWWKQRSAMAETMLCSPIRSNPHLQDLPTQSVAASGLPALSVVGDKPHTLLGFSESDRQPAWAHPMAALDADGLPMTLVAAQTGGGKTMLLLHAANQIARIPTHRGELTPVVIIDPKTDSDHTEAVLQSGGQVASLDDLTAADGVFDPIRFSSKPEVGVELAASMLMSINPWGSKRDDFETPLQYALHFGVERGAQCVGEALQLAKEHGHAPADMVDRAFELAQSSAMFRAIFGVTPSTDGLRVAQGITYIKVGQAHLDLPQASDRTAPSLPQRIAMALVRMMVFGSAMALTGRDGVIMLDEAWVFMAAGRAEMERLGRLARAQRVGPWLFTQRVTDALEAGLSGYIARGLIGPIQDADEARAACQLFKLEPTPERMARITAPATVGDGSTTAPNWASMRALIDQDTREVARGSVYIYADMNGRAVPVEVAIPPAFLKLASTNAAEIRARTAGVVRAAARPPAHVEWPPTVPRVAAPDRVEVPVPRPAPRHGTDPAPPRVDAGSPAPAAGGAPVDYGWGD